jgi:hypothetical protein
MDSALRQLRIIWLALLAAISTYSVLSFYVSMHSVPQPIIFRVIALLAVSEVLLLFLFRRRFVLQNALLLAADAANASALAQWRVGYIVVWAMSLSVALYGLVLRYLGFDFRQVSIFFIAGGALMLLFAPRRPSANALPN